MATTGQPVNLYQLGTEIGGTPSFRMVGPDVRGVYTVRSPDVADATLQAALDAHVADFDLVPPPTAEEERLAQEQTNASIIDQAITAALTRLDQLIAAPAVADVPSGSLSNAQRDAILRAMRDAVQQNRAGAQEVALMLKRTIRLLRGDYDDID